MVCYIYLMVGEKHWEFSLPLSINSKRRVIWSIENNSGERREWVTVEWPEVGEVIHTSDSLDEGIGNVGFLRALYWVLAGKLEVVSETYSINWKQL